MPAVACVGYPKGSEVNVDYYVNKHAPWVFGLWQPLAKSYRVCHTPAEDSPYEVMIFVDFESEGDLAKAMGGLDEATNNAIKDDLKNYSKKPPVYWTMEVKGTSS